MAYKPVMLVIMDGLGIRETEHGNAVVQGRTPNYDRWMKTLERCVVDASAEAVGLIQDQMGNSEVGHLNLGAGRVVYQDITRIDKAIKDEELSQHPDLVEAMKKAKENGSKLHYIGLVSDGGVHSHENHLYALIDIAKANDLDPIIHVITDGRDTPPNSGLGFVGKLEDYIAERGTGRIATVSGRYYAMDRDKRWERTKQAYDVLVNRQGEHAESPGQAIQQFYEQDKGGDEFITPTVVGENDSLRIESGDVLVFFNFRADRMRQIVGLFAVEDYEGRGDTEFIDDLHIVTFTSYEDSYPVTVLFHKDNLENTLAETISNAGRKQYHSAETEKYPHVTFFFNGRREEPFPNEDRKIIPSPKVATYDLKPEMSAPELYQATLERIQNEDDDFILINFANPDMVGHTGSLEAAIKAVEAVDEYTGKLVEAVIQKGGAAIVTADHGNCERMIDEVTGDPHTYHTTNPVSLFVIAKDHRFMLYPRGILADVAPTVLHLMELKAPEEMTGRSLIEAIF